MTRRSLRFIVLALCCVFGSSCVSVRLDEDLSDYSREIDRIERDLLENPQSQGALRDLGAIYMRTGHPLEASDYLQNAYALGDRDPKLLFYLALTNESLGKVDTALRLYESYPDVSRVSPYRKLMAGRYDWLIRERAHQEIRERRAIEDTLGDDILDSSIAVFSLKYQGGDAMYAPLGRGLADMLTNDLSNIAQLRVLERVRLQALKDEISLGEEMYVDPATAPRDGRLLRASRLLGGSYNVLPDNTLRLDGAILETLTAESLSVPSQSDNLDAFFRLEKRMLFAVLEELGIEPTESEQQLIQDVPTRNLQAFLAYCRGLMSEDARDYGAAAASFAQAAALDPTFSSAAVRSETATGLESASGTTGDLLIEVGSVDPLSPGSAIDLVSDRLIRLGEGVNASLISPEDARKPGPEGLPSLPDPPPPPGRN